MKKLRGDDGIATKKNVFGPRRRSWDAYDPSKNTAHGKEQSYRALHHKQAGLQHLVQAYEHSANASLKLRVLTSVHKQGNMVSELLKVEQVAQQNVSEQQNQSLSHKRWHSQKKHTELSPHPSVIDVWRCLTLQSI